MPPFIISPEELSRLTSALVKITSEMLNDNRWWILKNILSDLGTKGNLRHLVHAGHCGGSMLIGGQRMLNLSSNDYLGLASDTEFYADFLGIQGWGIMS